MKYLDLPRIEIPGLSPRNLPEVKRLVSLEDHLDAFYSRLDELGMVGSISIDRKNLIVQATDPKTKFEVKLSFEPIRTELQMKGILSTVLKRLKYTDDRYRERFGDY